MLSFPAIVWNGTDLGHPNLAARIADQGTPGSIVLVGLQAGVWSLILDVNYPRQPPHYMEMGLPGAQNLGLCCVT